MDSKEFLATLVESHAVFAKYQMNVHNDSRFECNFDQVACFCFHCSFWLIPWIEIS